MCTEIVWILGLEQNAAYLILRGLKTLHIRVRQQNATAIKLARTLEAHPKVELHSAL
jgi:cystathionine gamma-synthase